MSHNLNFDFPVLAGFRTLKERGWQLKIPIYENQIVILKFVKEGKTLLFLDNLNYFNTKLKNIGNFLGLEKLDMPEDYTCIEDWKEYCKRDVQILLQLWEGWTEFLKSNDMGGFARTIAGQGFNYYCHRQKEIPIYIHDNPKATKLEREGYFGGRTEAFYIGGLKDKNIYGLDVNSMYAYIMRENIFPTKLVGFTNGLTLKQLKDIVKKYLVLAKVRVNISEAFLPYRKEGKLYFPIGRFWTTLNTPELKEAFEKGVVEKVKEVSIYERDYIFTKVVDELYQLRLEAKKKGNKLLNNFYKLLMNSLYGKFGMRLPRWKTIAENTAYRDKAWEVSDSKTDEPRAFRCINGKVEQKMGKEEARNTFVAISSHITSYARLYLWKLINIAGRDNVVYCDTDSLFVNEKGFNKLNHLIDNTKLGHLKQEWVNRKVEIVGAKHYWLGGNLTLKGVKEDAEKIGDNKYSHTRFRSIKGGLRDGDINSVIITKTTKRIITPYNKGRVSPSGWVVPYRLDEK